MKIMLTFSSSRVVESHNWAVTASFRFLFSKARAEMRTETVRERVDTGRMVRRSQRGAGKTQILI